MTPFSLAHRVVAALVLAAAVLGFTSVIHAADAGSPPIPQPSDRVQINRTVVNGFVHPGIGLTKEILDNVRAQILAARDPWYSCYKDFAARPFSGRNVTARNQSKADPTRPDVDAFDSRSIQARAQQDAAKAYHQALMYFFTGDEVYRANAMAIIRIWSKMDPAKYKYYPDAHIHSTYQLREMLIAAELMQATQSQTPKLGWTDQDAADLTRNFIHPCINTFMYSNGWFMNQNGYALSGAMAGYIFTNNREGYNQRVEWFTVNKTAPNQGWSSSIKQLARLVDTNIVTGEKVPTPAVQLVEMGRDQAHAGDDVELFDLISRMMLAQGTKVDPVEGTVSIRPDAVGPYEFLNDRTLAAADYFCRFMLGYDTPWVPVASDIDSSGQVKQIYPRIADNYRGRLTFDIWGFYYYYTYVRSVDLAKKAPSLNEAFAKRTSMGDWLYIPAEARGEGARYVGPLSDRDVIPLDKRYTALSTDTATAREGNAAFIRVQLKESGTRLAILTSDNDSATIGLRIRSHDTSTLNMSGFAQPWTLPNTRGQWRNVTYRIGNLEHFGNFVTFTLSGRNGAVVDIDQLLLKADTRLKPAEFTRGNEAMEFTAFVGAPVTLDFSAKKPGSAEAVSLDSQDNPDGSALDAQTGVFSWKPAKAGEYAFIVEASDGQTLSVKNVHVAVAADRSAALKQAAAAYHPEDAYVSTTLFRYKAAYGRAARMLASASDADFFSQLVQVQQAAKSLELLTPLLPDGTMDYTKLVTESTIGKSIALLADGNDDTFSVYTLAKDLGYVFDFGPNFVISVTSFSLEGRLNFENRVMDVAFFGSSDGKNWTRLTSQSTPFSTEMMTIPVDKEHQSLQFRYLKIQKLSHKGAPLFEPAELRIVGRRYEVHQPN